VFENPILPAVLIIFGFSACLLAFQLALGVHFRHSGPLAPQMRLLVALSVCVWLGAVAVLYRRGAPPPAQLAPAVILLCAAALLFAVTRSTTPRKILPAAFAEEAPAGLIQSGPYRFIRHPFYVAYMLYWTGLAFAAPHPAVIIGAFGIVASYMFLARREEKRLLQGPLGTGYRDYVQATGRFLPRIRKQPN
jgi:protein-S-isoprenylcysteine O-methyltransferase Ste14